MHAESVQKTGSRSQLISPLFFPLYFPQHAFKLGTADMPSFKRKYKFYRLPEVIHIRLGYIRKKCNNEPIKAVCR